MRVATIGAVFTNGGRFTPPRGGGRKRKVKLVAPSGVIGIHCVLKSNCGMRITLLIRSAFTVAMLWRGVLLDSELTVYQMVKMDG